MPIYSYRCPHCGYEDEKHMGFDEDHTRECPFCRSDDYGKVYSLGGIYGDDGIFRGDWESRDKYLKRERERFVRAGKDPKDYIVGDPDRGIPLG